MKTNQFKITALISAFIGHCLSQPCARFHFPQSRGSAAENTTVTVAENSILTLNFELQTFPESCKTEIPNNFSVVVAKKGTESGNLGTYCQIAHKNGNCVQSFQQNCTCENGKHKYQLKKTANRTDIGTWVVYAHKNIAKPKEVQINVTYAPKITSIFRDYDASIAKPNSSVEVICFWENGNPLVKAQLLDRHGVELENSIGSSGQIRYKFTSVGCQDAGLIRCEAPGASQNKTAPLLVRCAPELIPVQTAVEISSDGKAELKVDVRSYTKNIRDCKMTRAVSSRNTTLSVSCSVTSIIGTPPDLTLTVLLDNVTTEDEGEWRLELTNDAGTGSCDFRLQRHEPETNAATAAAVVIVLILAGCLSATVVIVWVKKGKTIPSWCVRSSNHIEENDDTYRDWSFSSEGTEHPVTLENANSQQLGTLRVYRNLQSTSMRRQQGNLLYQNAYNDGREIYLVANTAL